jgi:hypothetical protein
MGSAIKGTWGNLGRKKEKEVIFHKWISSDGSELVPTTDVKFNLTLPSFKPTPAGIILRLDQALQR